MGDVLQIDTGPEEPVLWGNVYRSSAFIGRTRDQAPARERGREGERERGRGERETKTKTLRDHEREILRKRETMRGREGERETKTKTFRETMREIP